MTGFFNPQGFLTGIRQEMTQTHKGWALDTVQLWNEVTRYSKEDITRPPSEGAYVYGLFLEGAGFDKKTSQLTEACTKVLYEPMPLIHVTGIDVSQTNEVPKEMLKDIYVCPLYTKPRRTDSTFIAPLYLRCPVNKPAEHWILRGTALLCDIR